MHIADGSDTRTGGSAKVVTPTLTREPVAAASHEEKAFAEIAEMMRSGEVELVDSQTGRSVSLPEAARAVLLQASHAFLRGNRVALIALGSRLTTHQAAELLNVSRPFLIRLLEAGRLPFEMVGTHRRLRLDDVLRYRDERSQSRRETLRKLGREADDLGIYTE
jgi:excisionase family DNA binding protein